MGTSVLNYKLCCKKFSSRSRPQLTHTALGYNTRTKTPALHEWTTKTGLPGPLFPPPFFPLSTAANSHSDPVKSLPSFVDSVFSCTSACFWCGVEAQSVHISHFCLVLVRICALHWPCAAIRGSRLTRIAWKDADFFN